MSSKDGASIGTESQKKKQLRKPPVSRQSDKFKDLEQAVLEIIGDDYWLWLEKKYEEEIVNNAIGYNKKLFK